MSRALFYISKIHKTGNDFIVSKLKEFGLPELSPSHGDILAVLYLNDKITMNQIAKKIHRTKATLSVLIDKLEALEFVRREKSQEDSRKTFIVLTEKALKLKPAFEKISNELNALLYKGFSADEAKKLDELLEKMNKNK